MKTTGLLLILWSLLSFFGYTLLILGFLNMDLDLKIIVGGLFFVYPIWVGTKIIDQDFS